MKKWIASVTGGIVATVVGGVIHNTYFSDSSTTDSEGPEAVSSIDKWGLKLPSYIIAVSAYKTEKEAQAGRTQYYYQGYKSAGYLWVPDYKSLSGRDFYQVYIAAVQDRSEAKEILCAYKEKHKGNNDSKDAYAVKVSNGTARDEFNC